jgi:hypothetical protein
MLRIRAAPRASKLLSSILDQRLGFSISILISAMMLGLTTSVLIIVLWSIAETRGRYRLRPRFVIDCTYLRLSRLSEHVAQAS